jgi:hypothetical protein
LNVENCYIQNFTTVGIDVSSAEGATGTKVNVRDTNITNTGIGFQSNSTNGAGFVAATLENVRIDNCASGLIVKDRTFLTLRHSVVSACTTVGASIQAPSNSAALNIESSVLFGVTLGVQAGGAGTVVDLSNTSILNNSTGVSTGGGTVNSHGNNQIANNTSPGTVPTIIGQQ